jgi:hypothetical protein
MCVRDDKKRVVLLIASLSKSECNKKKRISQTRVAGGKKERKND